MVADRRYAGRRALVVETDPETRRVLRDVLVQIGFVVDLVESGVDAVSTARTALPELILLRDVPGAEALRWLRANPALKLAPVIAISATRGDLPVLRGVGIKFVLKKPLSAQKIRLTVHAAMAAIH